MEKYNISLRQITEDNFIEAFNLKLANGQERFVSHPIRSLAQAYVYRNQCQPFAVNMDRINAVYIYDGKDTWTDESGVEWNKAVK